MKFLGKMCFKAILKVTKKQGFKTEQPVSDNHFHNILRLFDVLTNFLFTKSETMRYFYL